MTGTREITVLSVRMPWAHWLLHRHPKFGPKWAENRSWISHYKGVLFIHASRWDSPPGPDNPDVGQFWQIPAGDAGPVGHILGAVDLVYSASQHDIDEVFDVMDGRSRRKLTPEQEELRQFLPSDPDDPSWEWWTGDAVLIVRNPRVLVDPIPTGGKLNLWRFNVEPGRLVFREPEPPTERKRSTRRRKK